MDRPIADIHEPYTITDELVKKGWNREHLTCGDFAIPTYEDKVAGIERKEASDLLNSLASGRLAQQLQNLINTYDYTFLLSEGSIGQSLILSNWNLEAVRNYLLTWQLKGIVHIRTSNADDTITRLCELVAYFSKPLHLGGLNKRVVGDERLLAFPSCVPIKQREDILFNYNTLTKVGLLTIPELLEFPNIGQARAEAIYNFYHKESNK